MKQNKHQSAKLVLRGILAVLLFLPVTLGAQTVIDNLMAARQWDLADAYYKAGERFVKLGDKDRGDAFMAEAKKIYPGYKPGSTGPVVPTAAPVLPPPVAPLKSVPVLSTVVDQNLQGEKIVRIQFSRLLSGYLGQDPSVLTSVLADQLVVTGKGGQPMTLTQAQAVSQAQDFLQKNPVQATSPDDLFQMNTLQITPVPNTVGPSYLLSIKTNPTVSGGLATVPFWAPSQTYLFTRVGDVWKLSAVSAL
jgi:hypothetical protein